MSIFCLRVEKHVLGGLLKHPKLLPDVDGYLTEDDFHNQAHGTIFSVLRSTILSGEKPDKVLIASKINNLGVSFKDEINIFDYIENLCFTQITEKATIEACEELYKLRIRREVFDIGEKIKTLVKDNGNKELDALISEADAIYNSKIASYASADEPLNVFDGIEELVEDRGNNPQEENGISTPYDEFNRLYGGLLPGNLYAIVSRPGQGKTTWLNHIAFNSSIKNNINALILDTEMSTTEIRFRMVSSLTGVPTWYLETGNWRKNPEYFKKVRAAWELIKKYKYYHYHVGNKTIDQVCSMIRRWHFTKVGRGNPSIISYDYIKLTGEKIGQNWAEHQAIGDKVDKLKKIAQEVNSPLITAMQLNRSGESFNRKASDVVDDASAISLSDRLQWFASFVAIFRRKTNDETALDEGMQEPSKKENKFGTHKLIPIKTRFQGKDAAGHQDIMMRTMDDGSKKYCSNYLNFDVQNFNVQEKGSLAAVIKHQNATYSIEDKNSNDNPGFL